jgi:hypothetical protein
MALSGEPCMPLPYWWGFRMDGGDGGFGGRGVSLDGHYMGWVRGGGCA